MGTSKIQVRTIPRSCSAPRLQQIPMHKVLIKINNLKLILFILWFFIAGVDPQENFLSKEK